MGFKTWCQVWCGARPFLKSNYVREFSNIWFQTFNFCSRVSSYALKMRPFFPKMSKTLFVVQRLNLKVCFLNKCTWLNFRNHARNHQLVKARCHYNVPPGSSGSVSTKRGPEGRVLQYYMVDRNMDYWSRFSSSILISPWAIKSNITKTTSLTGINSKLLNMFTFLIFSIYWNIYRPDGLLNFCFRFFYFFYLLNYMLTKWSFNFFFVYLTTPKLDVCLGLMVGTRTTSMHRLSH